MKHYLPLTTEFSSRPKLEIISEELDLDPYVIKSAEIQDSKLESHT